MNADDINARKEVIESVVLEFQSAFKAAKGFSHRGAEENLGGGVGESHVRAVRVRRALNAHCPVPLTHYAGMKTISTDALMKGQFDGAGIRSKKQEMTGEQLQKLEQVREQNKEQDMILDEISKGLDELQDLAEKMGDVSATPPML